MSYIIRNADNRYLWGVADIESMDMYGNITADIDYQFSCPDPEYAERFDSRKRADEVARGNGGIVQRLTIKTQDVELHWTESNIFAGHQYLFDGDDAIREIRKTKDGFLFDGEFYDDLDEAKEIAERAARKTWT